MCWSWPAIQVCVIVDLDSWQIMPPDVEVNNDLFADVSNLSTC